MTPTDDELRNMIARLQHGDKCEPRQENLLSICQELSELRAENAFLHKRRGELVIQRDEARADRTALDVTVHNPMDEFGSKP